MKLSKYLEYMTPKERQSAFKDGQTNLANALEPSAIHTPQYPKIEAMKKQFEDSYMKMYIPYVNKNRYIQGSFRGLICHNGQFYTIDQELGNHDLLVKIAYFDYQFPTIYSDDLQFWYENEDSLNDFVCVTFNSSEPKNIYMSESYIDEPTESEMQEDVTLYNHYYQLCKKIFGKEFIPEGRNTF